MERGVEIPLQCGRSIVEKMSEQAICLQNCKTTSSSTDKTLFVTRFHFTELPIYLETYQPFHGYMIERETTPLSSYLLTHPNQSIAQAPPLYSGLHPPALLFYPPATYSLSPQYRLLFPFSALLPNLHCSSTPQLNRTAQPGNSTKLFK